MLDLWWITAAAAGCQLSIVVVFCMLGVKNVCGVDGNINECVKSNRFK